MTQKDPYEFFFLVLNDFADITREDFSRIRSVFQVRHLKKHSHFIREGDEPDSFAFIVSGLFRSYYLNQKGEDYIKNFVRPGELISAYSSYLSGTVSVINIEALKDSLILVARFSDFLRAASGSSWETFRRKLTELLFVQREIREYELLTLNASDRYGKFREKFIDIEPELNDYHIASYLGISPVSLSRIKKKLKKTAL